MRVTNSHFETVFDVLCQCHPAWGWSRHWAGAEHLSWPGQRAGKPVMVTSVTSHSALRSRSPVSSVQAPAHDEMGTGRGYRGSHGSPLSRKLESREETAPALITFIPHPNLFQLLNHIFSAPYLFLLYLYLVGCLSHGQAAPPHHFCIVFYCFSLTARWKVSRKSYIVVYYTQISAF